MPDLFRRMSYPWPAGLSPCGNGPCCEASIREVVRLKGLLLTGLRLKLCGRGGDLLIAAVWLRWRTRRPAVDVLNEDVGAHAPTEKPAPPQGAQRTSMDPTERETTAEASVHTSATTCFTGVPEETAILLKRKMIGHAADAQIRVKRW